MCSATKEQRVKVFFKNKVRLNKLEKNRFNIVGQLVSLKKRNQAKPSIAFFPWSFLSLSNTAISINLALVFSSVVMICPI